jgi:ornithine--oxo-acid transaminase
MEFNHDLPVNGNHFAKILMKNGLLTKATHDYCVRFAPALVIDENELLEAVDIVGNSLEEF